MWPRNAAPQGVLAPWSKSHRVPGSLAQGFSPAGTPPRWLRCCPVAFSNKNREARRAALVSLYLSNRPVTPANYSERAGGIYEVRGESPTQRRLVPLRSRTGSLGAGHRTPAGKAPPARQVPRYAPPPLHRKAISTPRLNDGAPLGLPQLAPQRQAQELGGAQATPKKFALPPHCALHASRPLERLSTPRPRLPAHPITGPETRPTPPDTLTSSPVHHLFGAPLGHGFHGKGLCSQLG